MLLQVLRNRLQWIQCEFKQHAHRSLAFMQCLMPPRHVNEEPPQLASLVVDNLMMDGREQDTSSPIAY
jgi:hypothetical protein